RGRTHPYGRFGGQGDRATEAPREEGETQGTRTGARGGRRLWRPARTAGRCRRCLYARRVRRGRGGGGSPQQEAQGLICGRGGASPEEEEQEVGPGWPTGGTQTGRDFGGSGEFGQWATWLRR